MTSTWINNGTCYYSLKYKQNLTNFTLLNATILKILLNETCFHTKLNEKKGKCNYYFYYFNKVK
jgi:hypothetical protein